MPLWTPDVWGSGAKPAGTRSTQEGAYWFTEIIGDPNNVLCGGWGLVRLTGTVDRGDGFYRLDLPFEPPDWGMDGWQLLGQVTLGFADGDHRAGYSLHRNNATDPDAAPAGALKSTMIAGNGLWFVDDASPKPGVNIENFHWAFSFPIPKPEG